MKEIQIPRKNFARSSDPATKRLIKDPEMKNRKVAEKRQRQSATFSDVSVESTNDPVDSTPISQITGAISDSEAESFVKGSSLDLLSAPDISLLTDESPASTVTNKDFHIDADRIQSIVDLPASVEFLRTEISDLKKLISSVETPEEIDWIDGVVTRKSRIVLLIFIIWAVLAAIVVSAKSGERVAYYGPLPT